MKFLITGLGNMGSKYDETRHNIGFDVVDALARIHDAPWEDVRHGEMATFKHKGRTFLLLKPNTFMNLSGKAVRYWLTEEKIPVERSLTILDDLNLPLGKLRMRPKGSAGGHNGLKHIEQMLGHNKYPRLRVGIGDDFHSGQQVNFVLGTWTEDEKAALHNIIDRCVEAVKAFGTIGIARAMNQFN